MLVTLCSFLFKSTCYRPCSLDCATGGSPLLLQYKLLTLPSGIPANHNVVRLSAFSESGILQTRTSFTILEQQSETGVIEQVFGIRDEAGRGIIFTLQALDKPGLVRLKVQATTISVQGRITYQSIFIIYISISSYPYWASVLLGSWLCPLSGLWMPHPKGLFPKTLCLGHTRPYKASPVSGFHEDVYPVLWLCHRRKSPVREDFKKKKKTFSRIYWINYREEPTLLKKYELLKMLEKTKCFVHFFFCSLCGKMLRAFFNWKMLNAKKFNTPSTEVSIYYPSGTTKYFYIVL